MSRVQKGLIVVAVALVMYALEGCAAPPKPADLGWRQDMPQFQLKRVEWNVIAEPNARERLGTLCGLGYYPLACVVRIVEGGQCIVFSRYTEDQAKRIPIWEEGWSLWDHEVVGHCGKGVGGGWTHRGKS